MEKQVIQSVGFRNTKDENGNVTGFQFKVRLPYYRGIFLSQIRPGTLYIDGEKIEKEDIIWNIKGEDFTNEEMAGDFHTHWATTCPAVLKVKKPGGLAQGYHDLKYGFCFLRLSQQTKVPLKLQRILKSKSQQYVLKAGVCIKHILCMLIFQYFNYFKL